MRLAELRRDSGSQFIYMLMNCCYRLNEANKRLLIVLKKYWNTFESVYAIPNVYKYGYIFPQFYYNGVHKQNFLSLFRLMKSYLLMIL